MSGIIEMDGETLDYTAVVIACDSSRNMATIIKAELTKLGYRPGSPAIVWLDDQIVRAEQERLDARRLLESPTAPRVLVAEYEDRILSRRRPL
jgi:hypothetical protein